MTDDRQAAGAAYGSTPQCVTAESGEGAAAQVGSGASRRAWAAVGALLLASFTLVSSEFLPAAAIAPLSDDLGVSAGRVGLSVSVTAFASMVTAVLAGAVGTRWDRRTVMVGLAALGAASNLAVAVAPSFEVVLAARVLIGVSIGGFWALALIVVTSLFPPERVSRPLMVVNLGITTAVAISIPVGVLVADAAGWRPLFLGAAVAASLGCVALGLSVPRSVGSAGAGLGSLRPALTSPALRLGLLGQVLIVAGHLGSYTYVSIALVEIHHAAASAVATLLLVFGVSSIAGNLVIGAVNDRAPAVFAFVVPLAIALCLVGLVVVPDRPVGFVVLIVSLWGVAFGAIYVVLQSWVGRQAGALIEPASGLLTAGFQVAFVIGTFAGGLGVDHLGTQATFLVAAGVVAAGTLVFGRSVARPAHSAA